jgi:hypothetical protein
MANIDFRTTGRNIPAMKYGLVLIPLLAGLVVGCNDHRRHEEPPMQPISAEHVTKDLVPLADEIVRLAASGDATGARTKLMQLQDQLCGYTAGLEAAGRSKAEIQANLDLAGDHIGDAFKAVYGG